jgi:NAD(P)-dependent dehydrogenase (short-subunit alcohol dehydrogenase family)
MASKLNFALPALRFDQQVVLITGASSGIGRAAALAFARAGAHVVLAARSAQPLAEVAADCRAAGAKALAVATDVTRPESVKACLRKAIATFKRIDIVVNNAGIMLPARVTDLEAAELQRMLDVNLIGAMHVMQAAVRQMRRQESGGSIVNVASLAGRRGFTPLGGYCASKFALIGMTEALRTELIGEKISVSLVLPGVIDTPMAEAAAADPRTQGFWPKALNMPPAWVVYAIFAAVKLRLAEVAVPPGGALLEKLLALTPGTTDVVMRGLMAAAQRAARPSNRS